MFQIHLPPAGVAWTPAPGAVMVLAEQRKFATAKPPLLTVLLRRGFAGLTISDHGVVKEPIKHGSPATNERGRHTRLAIQAGVGC